MQRKERQIKERKNPFVCNRAFKETMVSRTDIGQNEERKKTLATYLTKLYINSYMPTSAMESQKLEKIYGHIYEERENCVSLMEPENTDGSSQKVFPLNCDRVLLAKERESEIGNPILLNPALTREESTLWLKEKPDISV